MKPIKDIIVKVENAYKDKIALKNGAVILLNQTFMQVKDTTRCGEVVAIPDDLDEDIQVGDTLFFHHGIVSETEMGNEKNIISPYLVDAERRWYKVPHNKQWPMAYAVLRNGEFRCLEGVCFVKPFKEPKLKSSIILLTEYNEKEASNVGVLAYPSPALKARGIDRGSKVIFEKDSEYQFEIDGTIHYCMFDRWILGTYED